jgi:hypothetical protein
MRVLQCIRNNPIVVLSVMFAALICWIALESLRVPKKDTKIAAPIPIEQLPNKQLKTFVRRLPEPPKFPNAMHTVSVEMLPKVKPGMSRVEVEELLGPPSPDQIQAVTESNGRLTYCTAYELEETRVPMTIRPIRQKSSRDSNKLEESKTHVTLEYDASKPGHPLIELHYTDPLF